MTPKAIRDKAATLRATDATLDALLTERASPGFARDDLITSILNASNPRTRVVSRMITERGVVAALGVVAGEAFLEGLESFAAATLPDGHPLKAAHPGIKRMISWLKTDGGLDIGNAEAHTLLNALASAGIVAAPDAATIIALSVVPDPLTLAEVSHALSGD